MRTKWAKFGVVLFLVLLPLLILWVYRQAITVLPSEVIIATGPVGGQFRPLMQSLAQEIEEKLRIKVTLVDPTHGSVVNRLLLQAGKVDFAPYQAGALENMERLDPENANKVRSSLPAGNEEVAFVTNLYLTPISFIVRQGAGIRRPADLRGKSVRLGVPGAGEYATNLVLMEHFGLDKKSFSLQNLEYPQLKEAFLNGTLDAAFITFGPESPVFRELFETGSVALLDIPNADAFAASHLSMSPYRIPAGLYHPQTPVAPPTDIQTVAVNAQLLARSKTNASLVEEVTKIVLSEEFQKKNQLQELFVRGREFARERPEFAIHRGALNIYETNPLLDPDVINVQVTILSFTLSFVIAMISGIQWLKHRQKCKKEHKLAPFIKKLSEIESRQLHLMADLTDHPLGRLESLLQEVTRLRREALGQFSARELNEDRAVHCFIETCHGISNEISVRLLRVQVGGNKSSLKSELQTTTHSDK